MQYCIPNWRAQLFFPQLQETASSFPRSGWWLSFFATKSSARSNWMIQQTSHLIGGFHISLLKVFHNLIGWRAPNSHLIGGLSTHHFKHKIRWRKALTRLADLLTAKCPEIWLDGWKLSTDYWIYSIVHAKFQNILMGNCNLFPDWLIYCPCIVSRDLIGRL